MKSFKTFATVLLLCGLMFPAKGKAAPILITSINPSQPIFQAGGITIVITGKNFSNKDRVGLEVQCLAYPPCDPRYRAVQFVGKTQLNVQLQAGDLSFTSPIVYSVFVQGSAGQITVFPWLVSDGTIVILPGDTTLNFGQQLQFTATSTLSGDTIQWSWYGYDSCTDSQIFISPPASLDQTGLFTAPATLSTSGCGNAEQIVVQATSTLDASKSSLVVVTLQ